MITYHDGTPIDPDSVHRWVRSEQDFCGWISSLVLPKDVIGIVINPAHKAIMYSAGNPWVQLGVFPNLAVNFALNKEPLKELRCLSGEPQAAVQETASQPLLAEERVSTTGKGFDGEKVDHPIHYNLHPSGVECIDVIEHMSFNVGNAIKYLWRADYKADAQEDICKAIWYLERELERRKKLSSS